MAPAGRITPRALDRRDPVTDRSTGNSDRDCPERPLLHFRERSDPPGDAFEARAVINRHVGECAIEPGPVEEQRSAGLYVAKTLRVRTEGGLTSDAESFHNRRGDCQGLGRHTASSPTHQLRY